MNTDSKLYDKTILIVDDTPENIDVLLGLLVDFKKKVAINGKKALSIVKGKTPPDLILLDVMMPEMDGYKVCQEIRKNPKYDEIPIIFLTAKAEKSDIIKGFEVGGQDYVTKPFDGQELLQRVKTNLEVKIQRELLHNVNEVLDSKVKERTNELNHAYEKLDKAMQKLKSIEDAKNNFLSLISHEIRTPLNGIIGATDLLSEALEDNNEIKKFLDLLQNSAERLENFSNATLLITELQSDNLEIALKKQAVLRILNHSINELREYAVSKNINFKIDHSNKEVELNCNDYYVEKIFSALIDNAIRYSPENSTINIRSLQSSNQLFIEILDSGKGFSKMALTQLFESFSIEGDNLDQSFGLNLKASKLIMKAHNGKISISNSRNGGALATLMFPLS